MPFDLNKIRVGDYVRVQIVNKKGDRNLDGCFLFGTVVQVQPEIGQAKLDSGWCIHPKDDLVEHREKEKEVENAN